MKKSLLLIALFSLFTSSAWADRYYVVHRDYGYRNHYIHRNNPFYSQNRYWHQTRPYHRYDRTSYFYSFRDHGTRLKISFR